MNSNTPAPSIFYIYKITNLINKKVYIGKTGGKNPNIRFYNHCKRAFYHNCKNECPKLYRSMRKYKIINFSFEILQTVDNEVAAYQLEKELIKEFDSIKNGMNTSPGGEGCHGGELNPMYGKGHLFSGESNGMFGKTGDQNPFYGKSHTAEFIAQIKKQNRILSENDIIQVNYLGYETRGLYLMLFRYHRYIDCWLRQQCIRLIDNYSTKSNAQPAPPSVLPQQR